MTGIVRFIKKETVLVITLIAAIISAFFVPPSVKYIEYIDFGVLAILLSLMLVIAGFQQCNVFIVLAQRLLQGKKNMRLVALILILLPFFSSMFITNDVALITFVPFSILVLSMLGKRQYLIFIIVAQTVAANLGSMATPFGNPQNLFLYTKFEMSISDFLLTMGVLTLCSLAMVSLFSLLFKKETLDVHFSQWILISDKCAVICYCVLFVLCLLSVINVVPYWLTLAGVILYIAWKDKQLLKRADYGLLATFVCFFIFSGNMGNIPAVQQFLGSCMSKYAEVTAIVASQVISNVPAAVLLSNFTADAKALLIGTNLGGLGTLIASLASLISFKFYIKEQDAKPLKYLGIFTLVNILMLFALFFVHCFVDLGFILS